MASGRLVDYLGHGNIADRPATPDLTTDAIGVWWSDDTSELSLWDGSAWVEDVGGGGGGGGGSDIVRQIVQTKSTTNVNSGGNTIPLDNTIPQNTEGTEFTQLATSFTPTDAASILEIEVFIGMFQLSTNAHGLGAVFKDSGANAIGATIVTPAVSAYSLPMIIRVEEVAGSTSARTYKFRYGGNGGTMYINQTSGGDTLGGTIASYMKITERAP